MQATVFGQQLRIVFRHEPDWSPDLPAVLTDEQKADKVTRAKWRQDFRRAERLKGRTLCTIYAFEPNPACPLHGQEITKEGPCSCRSTALAIDYAEKTRKDKNYSKEIGRAIALGRAASKLWPDNIAAQLELKKQYANRSRPAPKIADVRKAGL